MITPNIMISKNTGLLRPKKNMFGISIVENNTTLFKISKKQREMFLLIEKQSPFFYFVFHLSNYNEMDIDTNCIYYKIPLIFRFISQLLVMFNNHTLNKF